MDVFFPSGVFSSDLECPDGPEQQGQPVDVFFRMVMPGVPMLVGEPFLDAVQPGFGALVHPALIDAGQENLHRLVLQRHGMGEYHIHLPAPVRQRLLHPRPDLRGTAARPPTSDSP